MHSLTGNPSVSPKPLDKELKILIHDEINKIKYEIMCPCMGKISVCFFFSTFQFYAFFDLGFERFNSSEIENPQK